MDTIARGIAAEAAVIYELASLGIPALIPFGEGLAFDIAALMPPDGELVRIQVKAGRLRKGCVEFNTCSTDHGKGRQSYAGRADVIAVHAHEARRVFVVPVDECPTSKGYLRLDAPKNMQRRRVRFAADYTVSKWTASRPPNTHEVRRPS